MLSLARISAFVSYVCLGWTFISKMHSTIHFLSNTYIGAIIPFEAMHKVHKLQGRVLFGLAILHTLAHLIRWGLRHELGTVGLGVAGISGFFAIFFMTLAVLSMTMARRLKSSTFEQRLTTHWVSFVFLTAALCFHTERAKIILLCFAGLWFLDYLYGMVFRTYRLDIVEFSTLPAGSGLQMLWRNPEGFSPRSGE